MSGYFKRMSQLAQLSAAPANRSNQLHQPAHSPATIAISETASVSTDNHQPTTIQHVDATLAEALQPGVEKELNQRTTYSRPIESNSKLDEPNVSHGSLNESQAMDNTSSEKVPIVPNSMVGNPRLTEHMNDELQHVSRVTYPPEQKANKQKANRRTALPSAETQLTHPSDDSPTQGISRTTDFDQPAEPTQPHTPHTTLGPSDNHAALEKTLPFLTESQNTSIQQATETNKLNTVAVDGTNNQQAPTQADLIQRPEDNLSYLQQIQTRVASPAAPPQTNSKVDVKIGSITLTTDPEKSQAQPTKTVRPKHTPRTNGIWSSGRSFSRAYIRRS